MKRGTVAIRADRNERQVRGSERWMPLVSALIPIV
jgi:hypothetical protein